MAGRAPRPGVRNAGAGLPPEVRERIGALPGLPVAELQKLWQEAWSARPPRGARRRFLALGIAWRWQEAALGGLDARTRGRLAALGDPASVDGSSGPAAPDGPPALLPGTRLVRVWHGERHEVHVTDQGFLWRGRSWASLSVIARTITGQRRNGPAFFGLRRRDD